MVAVVGNCVVCGRASSSLLPELALEPELGFGTLGLGMRARLGVQDANVVATFSARYSLWVVQHATHAVLAAVGVEWRTVGGFDLAFEGGLGLAATLPRATLFPVVGLQAGYAF